MPSPSGPSARRGAGQAGRPRSHPRSSTRSSARPTDRSSRPGRPDRPEGPARSGATPGGARPRSAARAERADRSRSSAAGREQARRDARARAQAERERAHRSRVTSRAVVLVVVLAVLAVSYSSMLRAYLQQRAHLQELQRSIDADTALIAEREREIERRKDPAFIEQQGRALGLVAPGEIPFVALRDGAPLEPEAVLDPPSSRSTVPPAWWDAAWASVEVAGDPPRRTDPPPALKITDPEGAPDDGDDADAG
ncbi:septum formation initiator family protein [Nocardioides sp.]|uniref:septum formation initiator family protein n=1 Tax=Nocardioides sp. TaxID=35761 RepID=UPI0035168E1A